MSRTHRIFIGLGMLLALAGCAHDASIGQEPATDGGPPPDALPGIHRRPLPPCNTTAPFDIVPADDEAEALLVPMLDQGLVDGTVPPPPPVRTAVTLRAHRPGARLAIELQLADGSVAAFDTPVPLPESRRTMLASASQLVVSPGRFELRDASDGVVLLVVSQLTGNYVGIDAPPVPDLALTAGDRLCMTFVQHEVGSARPSTWSLRMHEGVFTSGAESVAMSPGEERAIGPFWIAYHGLTMYPVIEDYPESVVGIPAIAYDHTRTYGIVRLAD